MRMLLDVTTGADRKSGVHLVEDEYGLLVGVSNPGGTRFSVITDEQAERLERALYLHRVKRPFIDRKEPDADGEPRSGAELEGGATASPHS